MRRELLVALLFVLLFHLFNRSANDWPYRLEPPRAFGASPPLKILSLHPYQLATHRHHGAPRNWRGYAAAEDGPAFAFRGTATTNAAFSLAQREVLRKLPAAL
jgi:hypothetical protein